MRDLSPVVGVLPFVVRHRRKDVEVRCGVASQLVGHQPPWLVLLPFQELPKESLGGVGGSSGEESDAMQELKRLTAEGISHAIRKAEHYRLLGEPCEAESICLDALKVAPENHHARVLLILSLTD